MKSETVYFVRFYIVLICCFVFLACSESKESGFKITGQYQMIPDSTTVLMKNLDTGEVDSAYVVNGEFYFEGHVAYPSVYEFQGLNHKEQKLYFLDQIFVENSIILMEQIDGRIHVKGSVSDADRKAFNDELRVVRSKFNSVLRLEAYSHEDSLELEKYFEEFKSAKISFYKRNPHSYFVGYTLMNETIPGANQSEKMKLSKKEIREVYAGLTDNVKSSTYGRVVERYTKMPNVPEIGEPFVDLILPDITGEKVKLSDFKGKYILVDFWASWCSPCRSQNPVLKRLYEKYKISNFEILSVSIDDKKDRWTKAVKDDKLTWINVLSEGGRTSEAGQLYGINSLPDNILINPDGIIIRRNITTDALEELLVSLPSKE